MANLTLPDISLEKPTTKTRITVKDDTDKTTYYLDLYNTDGSSISGFISTLLAENIEGFRAAGIIPEFKVRAKRKVKDGVEVDDDDDDEDDK